MTRWRSNPASRVRARPTGWPQPVKGRPRVAAELDDPRMMLEAAIRGAAVAFVPRIVARAALAAGQVKALVILEPAASAVHALFPDSALAAHAVERLTEHARSLDT